MTAQLPWGAIARPALAYGPGRQGAAGQALPQARPGNHHLMACGRQSPSVTSQILSCACRQCPPLT